MKYELYSGDTLILAYGDHKAERSYATPDWLWQYGIILLGGQLFYCNDDLELLVDSRRAWRMKLPEGAIERRESPVQGTGCCRG